MITTQDPSRLPGLGPGSHVCWVVDDPAGYLEVAARVLADGAAAGQRTVAIGPAGGAALAFLGEMADAAVDPHAAFLGGGPLIPEVMLGAFRELSARARAEGLRGLRIMADMDWLLPAQPATDAIVAFELLLARVVLELDLTVVCAYRRASFDIDAITSALCVHPAAAGVEEPPPFRLTASGSRMWRLSGEVDFAVAESFAAAVTAAGADSPCIVDASGLEFIDVAGMREIARARRKGRGNLVLRGAPARVRRAWELAGFHEEAPGVEFVG